MKVKYGLIVGHFLHGTLYKTPSIVKVMNRTIVHFMIMWTGFTILEMRTQFRTETILF